jgi:ribosome biogenesis GTPase
MEDEDAHFAKKYYSEDRKFFRKERRIAKTTDRSQYKKSDQDQRKKRLEQEGAPKVDTSLLRGRVLGIFPEGIEVECEGTLYRCGLKGSLKQDKNRLKNLVAVGDFARFEKKGDGEGTIALVEERFSILSRSDHLSRHKEQLIAVNIDQVLITTCVLSPPLKPFLIDRYIIAARKGNMDPVIVINKIDLLQKPPEGIDPLLLLSEQELYREFVQTYTSLEIPTFSISATTGEGIFALKKAMQGKTSVISGQSGVGKSSLINQITGSLLATGEIVHKTGKGSHTTSTTHLIPLEGGGFCIDTPGIKSFGVWNLEKEEIEAYFSEIHEEKIHCKFPDCTHHSEPGCSVKVAVEEKRISPLRFASYCALLASVSEEHRHR